MKRLICFLSITMVLFFISSCGDGKHAKNYNEMIDEGSVSFIQQGLEACQTQIKASVIAASNSKNIHILNFAKSIIMDYDTTNDRLEKIAINNRIRGGDSISVAHQKTIANIKTLSGNALDEAYIQLMVTEYQNSVKLYTVATHDRIEVIQTLARKTLPILKMRLDTANLICATLE